LPGADPNTRTSAGEYKVQGFLTIKLMYLLDVKTVAGLLKRRPYGQG
jgi:hypothetical protein